MVLEQISGEPITGISSMATRHVLNDLFDDYRQESGQQIAIESVGGVDAARRVQQGESFDFVILARDAIDRLSPGGHIAPGSRVDVARSGVAIAVAAGSPRPDVGSEAAIRDTILRARSIGYSTGPSGSHLARLFERWGIAGTIAPRIVQAQPGVPVGTLVARGDVELGFQQLSELIHVPGIEVIDELPAEVQSITVFTAAICMPSRRQQEAKALLAFLASPQSGAAKLRHGMEPA